RRHHAPGDAPVRGERGGGALPCGLLPVQRLGRSMLSRYSEQLEGLAAEHRRRALAPRAGIDFASNDYLGMAREPALVEAVRDAIGRGVPVGSGGSRLLRGNDPEHEALEAEA